MAGRIPRPLDNELNCLLVNLVCDLLVEVRIERDWRDGWEQPSNLGNDNIPFPTKPLSKALPDLVGNLDLVDEGPHPVVLRLDRVFLGQAGKSRIS